MKTPARLWWLCAGLACSAGLWAQDYPVKSIHVIVPMQAGSAGDTIARIVARKISADLGQPLVIENITGAAGLIGTERLARAPADGYTIGAMGDSMLTLLPHLQSQVHYDPLGDFAPVSLVASITSVLVVHPAVPATSIEQLVAFAKSRPESLDFASGGMGSQQHVAMELFSSATGVHLHHVPFRGPAQAVMEVVSGRIPVMFVALSIAQPFILDGKLRAIAVASKGRSALLPAVPTVAEAGLPGFVFTPWVAIYAPRGAPRAVIELLNRETAAAVGDPDIHARLLALGLEPAASTPAELGRRTGEDFARMGKLIKANGIKGE
ncbi:MAG: tripartite tricarboxylate transporter substrate binding protein [Betaproteobacteria bacterium]|nr:tripartite tricarboxylate transporter substrate binding protein [Betaproteobacteria bacterium]